MIFVFCFFSFLHRISTPRRLTRPTLSNNTLREFEVDVFSRAAPSSVYGSLSIRLHPVSFVISLFTSLENGDAGDDVVVPKHRYPANCGLIPLTQTIHSLLPHYCHCLHLHSSKRSIGRDSMPISTRPDPASEGRRAETA